MIQKTKLRKTKLLKTKVRRFFLFFLDLSFGDLETILDSISRISKYAHPQNDAKTLLIQSYKISQKATNLTFILFTFLMVPTPKTLAD